VWFAGATFFLSVAFFFTFLPTEQQTSERPEAQSMNARISAAPAKEKYAIYLDNPFPYQ
jgi:hypothetical protein